MALGCPQQGVPVVCVLGWAEMGTELPCPCPGRAIPCSLAAVLTRADNPSEGTVPTLSSQGWQWHQESGVPSLVSQRDGGTEPWHSRLLWNSLQQDWQEKMAKCRCEPWMHRGICSASAGQAHHTHRLNQACPAPSHTSKHRAEGIFSQKEYQHLILLRGEKTHQSQTSSSCLERQGWQGAADGATSMWSRRAAGG